MLKFNLHLLQLHFDFLYLNTSYVKVQSLAFFGLRKCIKDLNTSYVKVQYVQQLQNQ